MEKITTSGTGEKWYRRDIDSVLGYTPGAIISDEIADFRSAETAWKVILDRYKAHGYQSVHNLMGLTDNCQIPDFFEGPEFQERYLATALTKEKLEKLAKEHLGGNQDHSVLALNRTGAANVTLMTALVTPGSVVPYLVPEFPGTDSGHGHPSIPRGVEFAGGKLVLVNSAEGLRQVLDSENNVSLIAICASYRGIVSEEDIRATCKIAHAQDIPVFLDDASGARTRIMVYGQAPGIDMGVDIVVTSCEKFGLEGPRAAVMVGRNDLMLKIGAKANLLGTEARPSIMAAMVKALSDYDPVKVKSKFEDWARRHENILSLAQNKLDDPRIYSGGVFGVHITTDDIMEMTMEMAGIDEIDLAPVDVSMVHAMFMLKDWGMMTVTNLHYPGAVKIPTVRVNALKTPLEDEAIAEGFVTSIYKTAERISDKGKLEAVLFEVN